MKYRERIIFLVLLMVSFIGWNQSNEYITVKGLVKEKRSHRPLAGVHIEVVGDAFTITNQLGEFSIKAKIGDKLIIRDDKFETVRYTVIDDQPLEILVKEHPREVEAQMRDDIFHKEKVRLAKVTLKNDAVISIEHVAEALEVIKEDDPKHLEKRAELFELLGDINMHWKQPDLAESNYRKSLENVNAIKVKIKLGKALNDEGKYDGGIELLDEMLQMKRKISPIERIIDINETIGDGYAGKDDHKTAIIYYKEALTLSERQKLNSRIIGLNAKLAECFQKQGLLNNAIGYYDNSIRLANKVGRKSSLRQKIKAADFYNRNSFYDKEIELRKEILDDVEEITTAKDSIGILMDGQITAGVQNYKIASAHVAKDEDEEAIPYLKESIKEAESKNDLVVQKDATRKLGELYRERGELSKASDAFEEYEVLVDKLYIQKEQEISQAARFSRELNAKQNRIATLEKDRELNENKYKLAFTSRELSEQRTSRQLVIIYALIGVTTLLLLVAYLMSRNIKQQRYANNLLALKSLRSQMNPHFIFNALNSVNTFIAISDELTANRYLTDFSLLMRAVLENSEEDFIPLSKEIELLSLYVKLEHFRFQDKFEYTIDIDPTLDVKQYQIPPMLLQPYVENAVWHGLRYKEEKGKLTISFRETSKNALEILVVDDGIGREKSKVLKTTHQKKQRSKGMDNIKKRIQILNTMYSDKVNVYITDLFDNQEGTKVKLTLKKDI
ncbi:tetratricopeptide repeat-containing sensor histidine kinase [Aquimarina rhabdastrellae]